MKKEVIEFWKPIIYKKGKIDEKQVMKELSDYKFIMEQVPKVYCEITGGLLSKLMYPANVVLEEFNERFWDKETIKDDISEILSERTTVEDKLKEIKSYLEI